MILSSECRWYGRSHEKFNWVVGGHILTSNGLCPLIFTSSILQFSPYWMTYIVTVYCMSTYFIKAELSILALNKQNVFKDDLYNLQSTTSFPMQWYNTLYSGSALNGPDVRSVSIDVLIKLVSKPTVNTLLLSIKASLQGQSSITTQSTHHPAQPFFAV